MLGVNHLWVDCSGGKSVNKNGVLTKFGCSQNVGWRGGVTSFGQALKKNFALNGPAPKALEKICVGRKAQKMLPNYLKGGGVQGG